MSAAAPALVLRDVHLPPSPSWWPPAPGWWMVAAAVLLVAVGLAGWSRWRRRRRQRWLAVFERDARADLPPPQQVAALDEVLRRAARRVEPAADRLQGEAWLAFLDGRGQAQRFSAGAGRALLDAPWRPSTDADVAGLRALVRARFLELMAGRR